MRAAGLGTSAEYSRWQAALLIGAGLVHLGCSDPGGLAQSASGGASGASNAVPSESGASSQSGATTAPAAPGTGGGSGLNWSLAPFSGGGSAGSGIGGVPLGGAGGSPSVDPVEATCPLLCDCIVDICANLRLFEHSICLNQTQCDTLSPAQRTCRLNECLQSQGDADPLKRCQHAIGQGEGAPAACQ